MIATCGDGSAPLREAALSSVARGKRWPPPHTVRNYAIGVGKTAERVGEGRPLGQVADDELGEALEALSDSTAVNTWNARRAAVLSWLAWCAERGFDGPEVPAWAKRLTPPDSETPARSNMAIDRLIARREVHLREKCFYRMLYETVARAEEILLLNIEDLDFAGRRALVKARGAQSRPAAAARPAPCWTSTPRCTERAQAGICTSSGTPV